MQAQETILALGHNVVTDSRVDPTCENTGLTEGSHCSNCNEVYVAQEVIPALGHTMSEEYCYDDSYHWHACSCGKVDGKTAHTGGIATETEKAVCDVCNHEYGQLLEPEKDTGDLSKIILPSVFGLFSVFGVVFIIKKLH